MGNFEQDWKKDYQNIKDDFSNKINIIFNYKKMKYNELCGFTEKVSEVKKRWSSKYGINIKKLKFIFNAKNLDSRLTIAESGITNMSQIFVIDSGGIRGAPENLNQNDNDNQYK